MFEMKYETRNMNEKNKIYAHCDRKGEEKAYKRVCETMKFIYKKEKMFHVKRFVWNYRKASVIINTENMISYR